MRQIALNDYIYCTTMMTSHDEREFYEDEWKTVEPELLVRDGRELIVAPFPHGVRQLYIPHGVEVVYANITFFEHIDLPDSVVEIDLSDSRKLKEIELPLNIEDVTIDHHVNITNLDEVLKNGKDPYVELV